MADFGGVDVRGGEATGDNPRTGFQRSVVSLIVEPDAGRMHVTRGNPGDMPYEVYQLD